MKHNLYQQSIILLLAALSLEAGAERFFRGCADASAAVALDKQRFIMADDEDNVLRIYNWDRPGSDPNCRTDISPSITFDAAYPEADIEGATWFNNRIVWITSHGRSKNGDYRPGRNRIFATTIAPDGAVVVDGVYAGLIDDLIAYGKQWDLGLRAAIGTDGSRINPKKIGKLAPKKKGLNIEGLCASADGKRLLIGLRNPRPLINGREMVLIIPLANPEAVILKGQSPILQKPVLIDLDGLGIRSMEYAPGLEKFLIVAGSHKGGSNCPPSRLYAFDCKMQKRSKLAVFSNITPEAVFQFAGRNEIVLLSDDGTRIIDTSSGPVTNKKLPLRQRSFRAQTIKPANY